MFNKLKKCAVRAVVAAAAASAVLASAGAAQADAFNGDPEVIYHPHPGGLTATVKNWRPGNTSCTYTADGWIVRTVNLASFSSQDLEFPGVPLFRPWDVKVNCDNGRSTNFVYWY